MHMTRKSGRWLPVRIDDFEKWQTSLLEESARRLGAVLATSGRIHRWGFIGSPVTFRGQRAWLRVSPFLEHEMSRKAWRGTAEAAAIPGVSKPTLLHRIEWQVDGPTPIPVSAEVLTLVTDPLASKERFLRTAPDLPADWFRDLSASLSALRAYPTDRRFPVHDAEEYGYLLCATYRRPVPVGCVPAFGTEHIDLNWENITAPRFQIIDMEHWCVAVTGYGAAYLYLTAFEVPAVAARVRAALADVLDTPTGRYAQLVAAALILRNLRTRKPYTGCNAGITHFHADPHGRASICKIGRDPQVDLIAEGADGLRRLAAVADALVTRHDGCSGCTLQKTCGTCMPLASLYRQAKAPLEVFCQHGGETARHWSAERR